MTATTPSNSEAKQEVRAYQRSIRRQGRELGTARPRLEHLQCSTDTPTILEVLWPVRALGTSDQLVDVCLQAVLVTVSIRMPYIPVHPSRPPIFVSSVSNAATLFACRLGIGSALAKTRMALERRGVGDHLQYAGNLLQRRAGEEVLSNKGKHVRICTCAQVQGYG